MKLINSSFKWYLFSLVVLSVGIRPAIAKEKISLIERSQVSKRQNINNNNYQQEYKSLVSTSAADLLAQNNLTRITGVEINQTKSGLELILKTVTGSERLVPLIVPEENSLVIDILDATLAFSIRNGVTELNPVPGISKVTVNKADENSIRVGITGANQTPSAEVVPGRDNLVLSITPEDTTAEEPNEEIEVIATGEAEDEDDYYVPEASSATRTDTPISDVPQSIQVISQEIIKDQQVTRIEQAVTNVSGVTYLGNQDGRGVNFAIRGFEEAPTLRDGFRVYGFAQGIPEADFLEQVEILKGPASILYGAVEPGGIVNLVSKQPLPESVYDLRLQLGNRNYISPSIDFSAPLTKDGRLSYRLNALYRTEESFRDLDFSFDRFAIAPTLAWQVGKNTDLVFNLEYISDDDPADFGTIAFGNGIADIPPERVTNNPDDRITNEYINTGYTLEHRFSDKWKLRNAFRYIYNEYQYGTDDGDVLALPFAVDEEAGTLTRIFADQFRQQDSFSLYTNVEGKVNTGKIEHILLAGIDLARNEENLGTRFDPTFQPSVIDIFDPDYDADVEPELEDVPIFDDNDITANRLGIYLQDQVYFSDSLILLAGLRYDTIDQDVTDNIENTELSENSDALTPRVGIVYKPIKPISLYASYAQSFNPNSEINADGDLLEPEEGEGFEVGVKGEIIPQRLAASVAYFNITKQNVATSDPVDFSFSVATGEQKSQGIELDLTGEIIPGWKIITSYAYIDAEVSEDNTIPVGNKIPGVPEHGASLWTTYEFQQGNFKGFGFGGGFNFVGARQGDLDNSFEVDGYFLTNAAFFYKRNRWQARLNFRNLFDVEYIESVGNSRTRGIYPGDPFTVIGSVSVQF